MIPLIKGKKVLFITTKNIDYIRNTQEIKIIRDNACSIELVHSKKKQYLFRILSILIQIYKKDIDKYDLIFIGFAPQLVLPFIEKKIKGKDVIIDFFVSLYDTLICDRQLFRKKGMVARISHLLDQYTLKKAVYVVTDTKSHSEFFVSEFGVEREKIVTLYLEADQTIYYPRKQNREDELKDKYIVLYFGTVLPLQGVEVILETIKGLKDNQNIFFDIIGPISSKYKKPNQNNVRYTDWLRQEELADRIANADLCLAGHFNDQIDKAKRTIPGKTYIYQSMGKRMILGDNKANRELFSDSYNTIFVKMGSAVELERVILEAYQKDREM